MDRDSNFLDLQWDRFEVGSTEWVHGVYRGITSQVPVVPTCAFTYPLWLLFSSLSHSASWAILKEKHKLRHHVWHELE